jgi:hypothetical protein
MSSLRLVQLAIGDVKERERIRCSRTDTGDNGQHLHLSRYLMK